MTKGVTGQIGSRIPQPSPPPAPGLSAMTPGGGVDKQSLRQPGSLPAAPPAAGVGGGVRKSIGRIGGKPKAKLEVGLGDGAENSVAAAATSFIVSNACAFLDAPTRIKTHPRSFVRFPVLAPRGLQGKIATTSA